MLDSLTIAHGSAVNGGGISTDGTLTVSNSTVAGNSASSSGGGISNDGFLTVINSTLTGNWAVHGLGGGIYNFSLLSDGTVTLSNSTLSNNSASNGGGIYNDIPEDPFGGGGTGPVTITGSTLSGNSAAYGGGIYNAGTLTVGNSTLSTNSAYDGGGIYNFGTLNLSNSTVSSNSSSDSGGGILNNGNLTVNNSSFSTNSANYGGGIFNYAGPDTISNSVLSTNSALSYGGGIYNQSGSLTISNSTFSSNSATAAIAYGGGIYNLGTLTLSDSTLLGNVSGYGGGGIVNYSTATVTNSTLHNSAIYGGGMFNRGTEWVNDSTLSGNSGSYGGGIYNDPSGTLNLTNTIVANSPSGDLDNLGALGTAQYNLIQSAAGHNIQNGSNHNIVGVDPLLYPLDKYGGPTLTFALRSHSPALAAGSTALIAIDPATGVTYTTDQRGQPRLRSGTVDIGTMENGVGKPYLVTTTADSGPGSLRDAITQVDADTGHTLYASPINPNIDEIDFAITAGSDTGGGYNPLTGVATIAPQSGLPGITSTLMIDGWSQPGFAGTPLIELDGAAPGSGGNNGDGLTISTATTVRGLVINRFSGAGIGVYGTPPPTPGSTAITLALIRRAQSARVTSMASSLPVSTLSPSARAATA